MRDEAEWNENSRIEKKITAKTKDHKTDSGRLNNQDLLNTVVITTAVTAVTTLR